MSYGPLMAIAITILAMFIAGLAIVSHVIGGLLTRQPWKIRPFANFLARYAVAFGSLLGLEILFLWLYPAAHLSCCRWVAGAVGGILRLAGIDASAAGSIISVGTSSLSFEVTVSCLGGLLLWVYSALVLAETGASRAQRLKGIYIGLPILIGLNILRITLSVYLESTTGLLIHDYFYVVNVAAVLLVWAGWVRTLRPRSLPPLKTT